MQKIESISCALIDRAEVLTPGTERDKLPAPGDALGAKVVKGAMLVVCWKT